MKLVVENLPDDLVPILRREANRRGGSIEDAAVVLIRRAAALADGPKKYRDLSEFSGAWASQPWLDDFERALGESDRADLSAQRRDPDDRG